MSHDNSDEEDYMSMAITEPTVVREKETYTQRRIRKQRESEEKGRTKSKAELRFEATSRLETDLARPLDSSNKGFAMLAKLGYKPKDTAETVGAESATGLASAEPIKLALKDNRGGLGLEGEKKRKFREEMEEAAKRVKTEQVDYRERIRLEREEKRLEGQILGAQKVAERLDMEAEAEEGGVDEHEKGRMTKNDSNGMVGGGEDWQRTSRARKSAEKPTSQINVLWRGMVMQLRTEERDRLVRHRHLSNLTRLPDYEDPTEDADDRQALGTTEEDFDEEEGEDEELAEFEALEASEKLQKLVVYLREKYYYCFWCKFRYPDESMDGCPGITEDDHD